MSSVTAGLVNHEPLSLVPHYAHVLFLILCTIGLTTPILKLMSLNLFLPSFRTFEALKLILTQLLTQLVKIISSSSNFYFTAVLWKLELWIPTIYDLLVIQKEYNSSYLLKPVVRKIESGSFDCPRKFSVLHFTIPYSRKGSGCAKCLWSLLTC